MTDLPVVVNGAEGRADCQDCRDRYPGACQPAHRIARRVVSNDWKD